MQTILRSIERLSALGAIVAGLQCSAATAAPSPDYTLGKQQWIAMHYAQAVPPLLTFRNRPYGRTAEVDYMIGTGGCRLQGRRAWGASYLAYTLQSYPLTTESRIKIDREWRLCMSHAPLSPLSADSRSAVSTVISGAGAIARGKLYNFPDGTVAAYPARRVRLIPADVIEQRRVPLGKPDIIAEVLRSAAPDQPRVRVVGRYAFVIGAGQTDEDVRGIAIQLDRYLGFLKAEYDIAPPDTYLAIYLMPDIDAVQKVAAQVHGLDVSPSTLGYSFEDDLSAVVMVRERQTGTLLHELFHLLVRASFGDIPQWLDEGIASLYEVADERGTRFVGVPNWRGRVLSNGWTIRPPLAEVITSPWFDFDSSRGGGSEYALPLERMAVHLATARYFALYLQERGKLRQVYEAFRARDPGAASDPSKGALATAESVLGPMGAVQADYEVWLARAVNDMPTIMSAPQSIPAAQQSIPLRRPPLLQPAPQTQTPTQTPTQTTPPKGKPPKQGD